MNLIKENEVLGNRYLTEVLKKDILSGLDHMSKNPPPPFNSKGFAVIIDNVDPSEPIMDVFDALPIPNNAKYLRKDTWVERNMDENAFINSRDYFIVYFTNPNDIRKIEHVGVGTDRGDNELIDEVLDLLNAKFGANF